jgi:hypothetical protein
MDDERMTVLPPIDPLNEITSAVPPRFRGSRLSESKTMGASTATGHADRMAVGSVRHP